MNFRSIWYYLSESHKSLFKNRLMSAASILTVSSCTLIFIISFCVAANVDYTLEQIENTIGLSAIIDDALTTDEVGLLYDEIKKIPHISGIRYISAEEALEIYKETFGAENESLLAGLSEDNPLPRSFKIDVDNINYQEYVIERLEGYVGSGFELIRHESELIDILLAVSRGIRMVSAVMIITLGLISVIIIMNTIKLTVELRSMEINIMKYVGATDSFIRGPFVIEGMVIGLAGAVIPAVAGILSYDNIAEMASGYLGGVAVFRTRDELFWLIVPICVAAGMFIGVFGSVLSIRKYLKV